MGQIKSKDNDVVERDNKDLSHNERTTKFLKCVHTKTHRTLNILENKHPTYQTFLRHFARVFNDFIDKYLDGYVPYYADNLDKRNLKKEEYEAIQNNFWQKKITIQEIMDSYPAFFENGSPGPEFTDHDVKLFKYLRSKSRRLLEDIAQDHELYWYISGRFAFIFDDLLGAFSTYYKLNSIDNLQNIGLQEKNLKAKEKSETADNSNKVEWSKRQKPVEKGPIHKRTRAPKRTEKELPFPDLKPYVEKNRTRKQMKLSLPPNLIKVVNKMVENEEFSRNEWIEYLIEKELKAQYPYLLQDNQNNITLENIA